MAIFDVTASIVLYKTDPRILLQTIDSFLNTTLKIKLYLIDNSPSKELENITSDDRCEYIFNGRNLGFGTAHNIALKKSISESKYHLVLNPDVYYDNKEMLLSIYQYMEQNINVGQLMPKILFPDGSLQFSGKLLPTPIDLIGRRLLSWMTFIKKRNFNYELRGTGYNKIMNVPHHLGCFMFIRSSALLKSGLFDERIFMYTEDIDLTRRIHGYFQTIYNPSFCIYHHYERGSRKKIRLLLYHIKSAIVYFNKWGWFCDSHRKKINKSLVEQYIHLI